MGLLGNPDDGISEAIVLERTLRASLCGLWRDESRPRSCSRGDNACVGDQTVCGMPPLAGPHPPSPIVKGSVTVMIGKRPAARMGDITGCGALIVAGAVTVNIGD